MIRALVVCVALLGGVPISPGAAQTQAEDVEAVTRQVMEAIVQDDPRTAREHAQALEDLTDAGALLRNWTRVAQYGLLAEVHFRIGDIENAARLYAKAAHAARQDGQWTGDQAMEVRYELGNTLVLLDRHADALAVGQELLADVQRSGALTQPAGMQTLVLVAIAQQGLGQFEAAEATARTLLEIALAHDTDGRKVQLASTVLAQVLARTGRTEEVVVHTRRATEIALQHHAPDSEAGLTARLQLGIALHEAGQHAEARVIVEAVIADADRVLPSSHEVALFARSTLVQIDRIEGRGFAARDVNRDLADRAAGSDNPRHRFDALLAQASARLAAGDIDAHERLLRDAIILAGQSETVPPEEAADAMAALARILVDFRGDFTAAEPILTEAIDLLTRHRGPFHIDTLRAEADRIFATRIEIETEAMWRRTKRRPVFWDGTEAGRRPTARDVEIMRRLAIAERAAQDDPLGPQAVAAAMNYAQTLVRADRYDDAVALLKEELTRVHAARQSGAPRILATDYMILERLGATLLAGGRNDMAAQVFRDGVDEVLAFLRSLQSLGPVGGTDQLLVAGQLYGENYARAGWQAAQTRSAASRAPFVGMVFEAMQLAGYGPASAAVSRAAVRDKLQDPELSSLAARWNDADFRNAADTDPASQDLDALRAEMAARFPEFFDWQVPEPLDLSHVQRDILDPDEAMIMILPAVSTSGQADGFRGMVLAVTRDSAAMTELTLSYDQLVFDILNLHEVLDPGGGTQLAALRAPMASVDADAAARAQGSSPFDFGAARRLHDAFFGAPDIARVIASKRTWTLVPFGDALGIPFPALVVEDPGDRLRRSRSPDDLRAVRWLGHERALHVVPSVLALADLRTRPRLADAPTGQLAYLGFGDPDFGGALAQDLPGTDLVALRSAPDRAAAVKTLPRLPGTRREVETLAALFGGSTSRAYLGPDATEKELRRLDASGAMRNADIVHFATHGLLTGAFEGLAEPALALTPPTGTSLTDDGLLTASEAAQLDLAADWVILSACDTAGADRLGGEGMGGLVQGFFTAGARNLLVSNWRIDDRAAEQLITRTVTAATGETGKAEALRQAMMSLAADTSRDTAALSNAHPSIWAPFLLVGGG